MARITLRQLLDHAAEHGYGVPAFNINNMEQGLAIMEAAAAVDAPVIIQASRGARAYANDIMLSRIIDALEEMYPQIPLCLHQDHGNEDQHRYRGPEAQVHTVDEDVVAEDRHGLGVLRAAGLDEHGVEDPERVERAEQQCYEDRRLHQRHRDPEEALHGARTVHLGRLVQLIGHEREPG